MQSLIQVLDTRSAVRLVGVYDGLSAYVAERAGAQALWVSGLCISASKALPDNETLTYETLIRRLEDVRRGSRLPVLADGNTGFGPQAIGHVVRLLESRGIDGLSIEDKAFPRRNSFDHGAGTCALEHPSEYAEKLSRAAAARTSDNFTLVARTEGFIAGEDLDTVLSRAERYCAAGADAIIVHSKSDRADEILQFARAWRNRTPIIVIPTTYPQLSFSVAASAGISGIICANQLMRASMQAAEEYVQQLVKADSIEECEIPLSPLSGLLDVVQRFDVSGTPR
jgi:phosphoenolpyruvate phosphomutase